MLPVVFAMVAVRPAMVAVGVAMVALLLSEWVSRSVARRIRGE